MAPRRGRTSPQLGNVTVMPDQSRAADEHAIIQEITAPLASLPDDPLPGVEETDFPRVRRGYDPLAVDAYVRKTNQLIADLQARSSPDAAVRRALERVGEQISGILQRAHDTAAQITTTSRREAEDRLEQARQEAQEIARAGEQRIKDLDADADRIWAERLRIIEDARELAAQLTALADDAAQRFPPADESTGGMPAVQVAHGSPEGDIADGDVPAAEADGAVEPVLFDAEADGTEEDELDPEATAVLPAVPASEPGDLEDVPDPVRAPDPTAEAPEADDAPRGADSAHGPEPGQPPRQQ